jgi:hypothetical protein
MIIHQPPEGWRNIGEAEQREPEADASFSRIESILGGNARRGPGR